MVPLPVHLALYFTCSLSYAVLCGLLGRSYSPLAVFPVYVITATAALVVALGGGRLTGLWAWRRLWPPSRTEALAAVSSVAIMSASTLALLAPASLVAAVIAKPGCLLFVARSPLLPCLAMAAAALGVIGKPLAVAGRSVALAAIILAGYGLKIYATRRKEAVGHVLAGSPLTAKQFAHDSPADFLAREQVLVAIGSLLVASTMAHLGTPLAPVGDWRLWAVGAASLGAGLVGTRIMLRAEPQSVTFPAYRMASLLAALGAGIARGESLGWSGWAAAGLALVVVWVASGGRRLRTAQ